MVRTQVQLTEQQFQALKALSDSERLSIAALIREAVDSLLSRRTRNLTLDRFLAAPPALRADADDVGERHDEYLNRAWEP